MRERLDTIAKEPYFCIDDIVLNGQASSMPQSTAVTRTGLLHR